MKKLTAYNSQNDREIGMMMKKAMCAYANYKEALNEHKSLVEEYGVLSVEVTEAQYKSEYEATVRCIDMFAKESIDEIHLAVIESCKEEFGI